MNITEQIINLLKQAIDKNTILDVVYIKLGNSKCYTSLPYNSYPINIEDYMNGYECVLCKIGYLTYHSNIYSHFSVSLTTLTYNQNYSDIITKGNYFHIPIELYIQNNKLGVSYFNGTILNVFGDSVQEIVDNLNTMCNNNPNFKLHLNEKFTNLMNKD